MFESLSNRQDWPVKSLAAGIRINKAARFQIDDLAEYRILGVKNRGAGVAIKRVVRGSDLIMREYQRASANQLMWCKVDTKNGALGVTCEEHVRCLASPNMCLADIDVTVIEPRLLQFFFQLPTVVDGITAASLGTTNRQYLKPQEFLDSVRLRLPPLPEQGRIVARIEELAVQIHEARTLRHQAAKEVEVLLRAILTNDQSPKPTAMRELVKLRSPDVVVRADETYQFAGVYSFGRGVFRASRKSGMDFAYPRLTQLRTGEFVYPKLMAWEGALGVVPPECNGCVVSTEFPVFEVNEDRVLPEVLDVYFRTPSVWPEIAGESTGTNVRRRRLNPQDFLDYEIPLPSRETQMTLRKVQLEMDALKHLQAETAVELDALLPAVLDKAFKGEL